MIPASKLAPASIEKQQPSDPEKTREGTDHRSARIACDGCASGEEKSAQSGAEKNVDGNQCAAETGPLGNQILQIGDGNRDQRRRADATDQGEGIDMPGLMGKSQ